MVFTPRVVEAAGVAGLPGGKQMLMNEVLGEVFRLSDSSISGLTDQQRQPLHFEACAVLPSISPSMPHGATVAVELDLFGSSTVTLGACILCSYALVRTMQHHSILEAWPPV
jgi:hypothetical protein